MFRSAPQKKSPKTDNDKNVRKGAGKDKIKLAKGEIGADDGNFSEDDFENLFSEQKFKPKCDEQPEHLGLRISGGSYEGPTPIGGFCFDQKDKKDCGKKCIPKSEPCNGTCSYDQCLLNNKCQPLMDEQR